MPSPGEEQGHSREAREEDERESLVGHGFLDDFIEGLGLSKSNARIDLVHCGGDAVEHRGGVLGRPHCKARLRLRGFGRRG